MDGAEHMLPENIRLSFTGAAATKRGVRRWLRRETLLEIKKRALLDYLHDMLLNSEYIVQPYLDSAARRMEKLSEVMGFLAAWRLKDNADLYRRLGAATEPQNAFVRSKLCRFDTQTFFKIGNDIHQLSTNKKYRSKCIDPKKPAALRGSPDDRDSSIYRASAGSTRVSIGGTPCAEIGPGGFMAGQLLRLNRMSCLINVSREASR